MSFKAEKYNADQNGSMKVCNNAIPDIQLCNMHIIV